MERAYPDDSCEECGADGTVLLFDMDGDGVCDYDETEGCTMEEACNYNPYVSSENGTCIFVDEEYDCDGNCLNDIDLDGVCDELEVSGCMDTMACNYDMMATDDNGSCDVPVAGCEECVNGASEVSDSDGDGVGL